MFGAAWQALGQGEALLIFPEGVSQPEPALMPLRTGAARLVLGADRGGRRGRRPRRRPPLTTLLPVASCSTSPAPSASGSALCSSGQPCPRRISRRWPAADRMLRCEAADRAARRSAPAAHRRGARPAHARAGPRGRGDLARGDARRGARGRDRAAWRQRAARAHRYLARGRAGADWRRCAARLERLRQGPRARRADRPRPLRRGTGPLAVLRYGLREGLALALGLPLALWGVRQPRRALPGRRALAVRRSSPSRRAGDVQGRGRASSLFPLCWALEGWTAWRLGGGCAPRAFPRLAAARRASSRCPGRSGSTGSGARRAGSWPSSWTATSARHLLGRRRAIMAEFQDLLRLVPEPVLEEDRAMNARAVVAWTLYDFANSAFAAVIFATIYAAYYAIGVVGNDAGAGDLWWGRVISVSMAMVAVTSPFLGGDRRPRGHTAPALHRLHGAVGDGDGAHGHGRARHGRLGIRPRRARQRGLRERPRLLQRLPARARAAQPPGARVGVGLRRRLRGLHRGAPGGAALRARQGLRGRVPLHGRALRRLLAARLRLAAPAAARPAARLRGGAPGRGRRCSPRPARSWGSATCAASSAPTSCTRTASTPWWASRPSSPPRRWASRWTASSCCTSSSRSPRSSGRSPGPGRPTGSAPSAW